MKHLISKILAYSAIKIKAKFKLPYSTLNPDTSYDSPSAKSKGVRLVSANAEIKRMPTKGKKIKLLTQKVFILIKVRIFILFDKIKKKEVQGQI